MRTIFIPTTTLNFNNIMSSESISPKAFYSMREFGYKTWHNVDENPLENSMLLYEEIPAVKRVVSDYDDYPMVIAITVSEEIFEDFSFTNIPGVWQYDKTLYFNPSNTTIFFDTEEHKRIALSKSESSAETKMVALYQSRMLCAQMSKVYDISSCKDVDLCTETVAKDQKINKFKGFLYGYYIGASLSMNDNDVMKLNILNEIKNVFAAILASLDGIATNNQIAQLQNLFVQLKQFDPLRIELSKIIESAEISTIEKVDRIVSMMNNSYYRNSYSNDFQYLLREIQNGKPEYGENQAIAWINKTINVHIAESKSHKSLLSPESEEVLISSLTLSSVNTRTIKVGKPQELFMTIVNNVLTTNKYNGKISTFKLDLATDITYKAKDVFVEEWNENCTAKTYLNALRKHIGGEPFNQSWNSGILGSIASVILKGDDWEKLLEFLQSKGIADYRLAFAFYGAINGFANITRDFSDIILKERMEYVQSVYQHFHKQLHGVDACVADIPEYSKPVLNTNLRFGVQEVFGSLTSRQKEANAPRIEQALELEAAQGNFDAYLYILNNLVNTRTKLYKEMVRVLKLPESHGIPLSSLVDNVLRGFTKKSDLEYCRKARFALELEDKIGDPVSFCYMLDDFNIPKDIREKFFKYFGIEQQEQSMLESFKKFGENFSSFFGGLFGGEEEKEQDPEKQEKQQNENIHRIRFSVQNIEKIAEFICSLNPGLTDFAHNQIVNDLKWIFDPKYSSGRSVEELLETFRLNLLSGQRDPFSKNGKDMRWKNDAYKPLDVEKTIKALKQLQ